MENENRIQKQYKKLAKRYGGICEEGYMSGQMNLDMQSIQATMLIPLYARAKMSRRFPGILYDKEAIRILDEIGGDLSAIDKIFGGEYAAMTCLVRAVKLEDRARAYITEHPNGTVVNLGAGMDATFSRVDNGKVIWYNLDLPDAIACRERYMPPSECERNIAKSMFDYEWLGEIKTSDESLLLLAGGLFYYFGEAEIRELVVRLCEQFPNGELFFDAGSSSSIKVSNSMVRKTGNESSPMKFWVNGIEPLKQWSPRITAVESFSFFGSIARDKRLRLATRAVMRGMDILRMGKLISIRWKEAAHEK